VPPPAAASPSAPPSHRTHHRHRRRRCPTGMPHPSPLCCPALRPRCRPPRSWRPWSWARRPRRPTGLLVQQWRHPADLRHHIFAVSASLRNLLQLGLVNPGLVSAGAQCHEEPSACCSFQEKIHGAVKGSGSYPRTQFSSNPQSACGITQKGKADTFVQLLVCGLC
jgi:hypothetical protein